MLNELQNEVLKELVNIAFGKATGSLSELLDAFATLHVPHIEVLGAGELNRYLGDITENDATLYVSQQVYSGALSGETLFLMNDKSVVNLARHLYGDETITQNHIDDAVLEVNNILSVTTIGKLAETMELSTNFLAPTLKYVDDGHFADDEELEQYSALIIVRAVMAFEDEEIQGHMLILTADTMLTELIGAIDRIIEEQLS